MERIQLTTKPITSIDVQRDFGVQFHSTLKMAAKVDRVGRQAYGILALIALGIEFKSQEVMMQP